MGVFTSFSPTRIWTVRPFGMTCARSLSLTVCLLILSGWTLRFSRTSGLNRPPARSLDKSFRNCSIEAAMSDSRAEKSLGSSAGASLPDAFCSSRAALPPFFCRHGEVAKVLLDFNKPEGARYGCRLHRRNARAPFLERMFHDVALVDFSHVGSSVGCFDSRLATLLPRGTAKCSSDRL